MQRFRGGLAEPRGGPASGGYGYGPAPQIHDRSDSDEAVRASFQPSREEQIHRMMMKGPPKRLVTAGNQTFYTPDVENMNAYQRQWFLPQGSSFSTTMTPAEQLRNALAVRDAAAGPREAYSLG